MARRGEPSPSSRGGRLRPLRPTGADYPGGRRAWWADVLAGTTVAVVALPLALGFGVASGLGAQTGIVTAIVAGIVAGVFGGSDVQVSGPTGAMTVVLVPVVANVGPAGVALVAVLAGALLVGFGVLRLGRYAGVLPWPVIEGFTVGIAMLIFLQQVPAALGVARPHGDNTALVAAQALRGWEFSTAAPVLLAVAVACCMLAVARMHHSLPAALFAVAAATVASEVAGLPVAHIGHIPSALPHLAMPQVDGHDVLGLSSAAFAVAALAAIESLLAATVADGMADGDPHDPDRELVGQGLANVAAGLFGGMPATGAIARTAVNVRAGARTRRATIWHGLLLMIAVVALAPALGRVPLAALAGVLMVTALRMVDVESIRRILRSGTGDVLLLVATAAATVVFDLVTAVGIGIALAGLLALKAVADATSFAPEPAGGPHSLDHDLEHELLDRHIVAFRLDGALFFGAAQRFLVALTDVADVDVVILRLGSLKVLDSTGAQALADIIGRLEHRGITVLLAGARPEHLRLLDATGAIDALRHERHLLPSDAAAIEHARDHVQRAR